MVPRYAQENVKAKLVTDNGNNAETTKPRRYGGMLERIDEPTNDSGSLHNA